MRAICKSSNGDAVCKQNELPHGTSVIRYLARPNARPDGYRSDLLAHDDTRNRDRIRGSRLLARPKEHRSVLANPVRFGSARKTAQHFATDLRGSAAISSGWCKGVLVMEILPKQTRSITHWAPEAFRVGHLRQVSEGNRTARSERCGCTVRALRLRLSRCRRSAPHGSQPNNRMPHTPADGSIPAELVTVALLPQTVTDRSNSSVALGDIEPHRSRRGTRTYARNDIYNERILISADRGPDEADIRMQYFSSEQDFAYRAVFVEKRWKPVGFETVDIVRTGRL